MGNILDFPTPKTQGLAFLESQLREILLAKGADQQLVDFASRKLSQIYATVTATESYSFSVQLPDGLANDHRSSLEGQINSGLQDIRDSNHSAVLALIAKLVLAEIRLFQLQRD